MPLRLLDRWQRLLRVRLRRAAGRLDRLDLDWLGWAPSWGTSILVHAAVLLILAVVYLAAQVQDDRGTFDTTIIRLGDVEVDSLVPADHAGDPFTDVKLEAAPSISLSPSSTPIASQPPSLPTVALGPTMSLTGRSPLDQATNLTERVVSGRSHTENMTAPFSGRSGATRAELVRREGGSIGSEKAVAEGLAWLARHQRSDGGWNLDVSGECQGQPACFDDTRMVSDTAATGLALLPFLGAGHIHTEAGRYQATVQRGIDWLVSHQRKSGDLFLGGFEHAQFYSHGIATMALCESYGLSKDERLKEPAQRAIRFIIQSQNKDDGGWRYFPGQPGDTSVHGWQVFALRSARLAGLEVPRTVIRGCSHYLDLARTDKHGTTYGYLPSRPETPTMNAEGLLCRQYLGWPRDHPALVRGTNAVWNELQDYNGRNIYYWYYATQLLHNMHNKAWKQWNIQIRDGLVSTQVTDAGCGKGSWSPHVPQTDAWGRTAGRLYQTSLSILTLEVYYRFLPLYRDIDLDGLESSDEKAKPAPAAKKDAGPN